MKLALVLHAAGVLATQPRAPAHDAGRDPARCCIVVGAAILLIASQPDLGTALVIAFTLGALLLVAGVPIRLLGKIGARVGACSCCCSRSSIPSASRA